MLTVYIHFVYWKWKESNRDSGKGIKKKSHSVEIADYAFRTTE